MLRRLAVSGLVAACAFGQTSPLLTLQQAEAIALRNHPQIQAAQNEVNFANQQVIENRSAWYPAINGVITGSQSSSDLARVGAGALSPSRLYNREAQGVVVNQLITDSGRTSNLVASSRLQAQAAAQNSQATSYDVLLQVNRAYFEVLRAQAVVRVAQETVRARQTFGDQVTELFRNQLKSQLDVSSVEVTVSEAKLLLLRAQSAVQQDLAELGRAMGSDQPANYSLAEQTLPAAPPVAPDEMVAQALAARPELAGLKLSRDSAYKFAEAEKDLSRPTVSAVAVAGLMPYIDTAPTSPVPDKYEGIAANVNIPIFNGHLFAARREAANQRALEADQRLRAFQQQISRDVRVAWADASDAYQRLSVTAQFIQQATTALDLAQERYQLGLSTIVELTQSQLNLTEAQIEDLNAKFDYQTRYAALQYTVGGLR